MAAWQRHESDTIYFIGREVTEAGLPGEPDSGVLKLFEINSDGSVAHERVIWAPTYDGINLEDPRALELDNENLNIGLTAVLRDKNGNPVPFPAIIKINSHYSWQQELPPFLVISSFGPGKNLTPNCWSFLSTCKYQKRLEIFSFPQICLGHFGELEQLCHPFGSMTTKRYLSFMVFQLKK